MAYEGVDHDLLNLAVERLLGALDENDSVQVLYTLRYTQSTSSPSSEHGPHAESTDSNSTSEAPASVAGPVLEFPPSSLDPIFDDDILEQVKEIWKRIIGQPNPNESETAVDFMVFEDREGMAAGLEDDE